jgi:hypothetical protein
MNSKHLQKSLDKKLLVIGKEFSVPVHQRLTKIFFRLQKDFPITGVWAGMGLFGFRGGDFPVVYSDDSEGTLEMSDLLDYFEDRKIWQPKNLTKSNEALMREFIDLMNFLEDTPYLELFELNPQWE